MILNLNNKLKSEVDYDFIFMPDGQPHITLKGDYISEIICSLTSMNDFGKLAVTIDAACRIPDALVEGWKLVIPYMLGARQDRAANEGEANTCTVICELVNDLIGGSDCGEIVVLHPHSNVIGTVFGQLFTEFGHTNFLQKALYDFNPDFLIIPDLGAAKNAEKYSRFGLPQIQCYKKRDTKTGKLTGFGSYEEPPAGPERRGLIVDDICDKGGTFLGLADLFPHQTLALYTTHGLYNAGFKLLNEKFEKLYCTNSYHYKGIPVEIADQTQKLTMYEVLG